MLGVETGGRECCLMALESDAERCDALGPAATGHLIPCKEALTQFELFDEPGWGGRTRFGRAEDVLRPRDEGMRLGLLRFKSSRVQRTFESLSKLAHGSCRRLDARVEREAVDRERGAEVKQGGAAEGLLGAVVETRRHDLEPQVRRERGRGARHRRKAGSMSPFGWLSTKMTGPSSGTRSTPVTSMRRKKIRINIRSRERSMTFTRPGRWLRAPHATPRRPRSPRSQAPRAG